MTGSVLYPESFDMVFMNKALCKNRYITEVFPLENVQFINGDLPVIIYKMLREFMEKDIGS